VRAAARLGSFAEAAFALELAGIAISARHVGRITHEVGQDMARQRDQKAVQRRRRQLPPRAPSPPAVAVVEVDGGRLRTRQPGCGPGVHQPQSKEEKIACLVNLDTPTHPHDPQPDPPPSFLEPRRVQRLVQQMQHQGGGAPPEADPEAEAEAAAPPEKPARPRPPADRERVRTCVASMANSRAFGPMLAAEAQERDFFAAPRQAFVADGAAYNWSIQQGYFTDFEPITDFLHVLCYLYLAAQAVGSTPERRWEQYVAWTEACWRGRVGVVLEELRRWQEQSGRPPPGEELDKTDARAVVEAAVSYLGNNQERMAYPRYRQAGLPVTSSLVESLVGEFNARVKGREKFWNRPEGAEGMLQVRAAYLSEDGRLARYFAERPGNPYRRRRAG